MTRDLAPLVAAVRALAAPAAGINVVRVPDHDRYWMGRSSDNALVLLTPPDDPAPPTRLRRLSLAPRQAVRITSADESREFSAGVVGFHTSDDELVPYFVRVAHAVVDLLGPAPVPGDVRRAMQRLVQLFEPSLERRGSIIGVWGELFLIARSSAPDQLVAAWHTDIDDRFDFASPRCRLEVKTTASGARIHRFNLHQLEPVDGAVSHIVSIMTTETDSGVSLGDIVDEIASRLSVHPLLQLKVHEQVARTLGREWFMLPHRFDDVQAAMSVRVFNAIELPRVPSPLPPIVKIALTIDCSALPGENSRAAGLVALVPTDM